MTGIGSMISAWGGDPTFNRLDITKNAGIQALIGGATTDASTAQKLSRDALGDYITKYLSGVKDASARTSQEIGAIDPIYNGGMASQLAQLRASRGAAMTSAADLATQQALRSINQSRITGQGGGGSYADRMAVGAMQPIRVQAALDNSNQARSDLGTLTSLQTSNLGTRQGLADALASYGLKVPQVAQTLNAGNLQSINSLTSSDNANNIYGVQQHKTDLDKISQFLGAADNSVANIAGMASNLYGAAGGAKGGGGGGSL